MGFESKFVNCYELEHFLKDKLGKKINIYGVDNTNLFGEYFSQYRTYSEMFQPGLPFYIRYCLDGYIDGAFRISVGNVTKNSTVGEKLAALSDFYLALVKTYGNPTAFYTTKEDVEKLFTLQWSFANKEEVITKFKNNTYFDDANIDKLIIIDEKTDDVINHNLKDETKQIISEQIGLPFELLPLINENLEDYLMYTKGKKIEVPKGVMTDCLPVTSFEEKPKTRTLSK